MGNGLLALRTSQRVTAAMALLLLAPMLRAQESPVPATAPTSPDPQQIETERLQQVEERLESPAEDELRRDRNREVLNQAGPLSPSEPKNSLLRRMTRVFVKHNDIEDARSAAAAFDPDAFERAKSLIVIAEAERLTGQEQQSWWSLHEAQEIALKLTDQEQALNVFRQIGDVELRLTHSKSPDGSRLDPTPDELVTATLCYGLPKPGFEEIEILRVGGGPLREPQIVRHIYYYNGCRKFQGPLLRGGPTIIRVTHPKSGCACDICLNLPRGAPRIDYTADEIDYEYPDVEVHLHFHSGNKYSVTYSHFDAKARKWVHHLLPAHDESGFWFFGGETNAVKNIAAVAAGPALNVSSRLPLASGLLRPEEKRIRNTMTPPQGLRLPEILKSRTVR